MENSPCGFESLPPLPTLFCDTQCVSFNSEILILGGLNNFKCYSYHTLKKRYKFICCYPSGILLWGHSVVKCKNSNSKSITLFSFGGKYPHSLKMEYQSVWKKNISNNHNNHWQPNNQLKIGAGCDLEDVRALVDDTKYPHQRQLLFVMYKPNHIEVIDLNSFQCLAKDILPIGSIVFGCAFASTITKGMVLFNKNNGVSVKYDQKNGIFEYEKLSICPFLQHTRSYSYVSVKDLVILLGGFARGYLDAIYVYSTTTKKWKESPYKLPKPLAGSFAVFTEDNTWIHIIGDHNKTCHGQHFRIKLRDVLGVTNQSVSFITQNWMRINNFEQLGWIEDFNVMIFNFL